MTSILCGSSRSKKNYNQFEARMQDLQSQVLLHPAAAASTSGTIRTTHKRSMYVRALFEYDPSKDSGLPSRGLAFSPSDILHVTNASDDEWWQARKIYSVTVSRDDGLGTIPSDRRVERKQKSRLKNVKFHGRETEKLEKEKRKKNSLFSRKANKKAKDSTTTLDEVTEIADDLHFEDHIPSYEEVVQQDLHYTRPVIILGCLKDRIANDIVMEMPDLFATCVPHTSRSPRDTELDGREYHFMSSREDMERAIQEHKFIEAGVYNGNIYGTSVEAVRLVAERGQHCVLHVSGNAIRRLQANELYPIVVFVNAPQLFLDLNRRLPEDKAQEALERVAKEEADFGEHFSAVVRGDTLDEVYDGVKVAIQEQSRKTVWVNANRVHA